MNAHTVHQLLLDVSLPTGCDTRRVDERLHDFATGPLANNLDKAFAQLPSEHSIRLEKLEIDLGALSLESFLRTGAQQIRDAVSKELAQQKHSHSKNAPDAPQQQFDWHKLTGQSESLHEKSAETRSRPSPQQSTSDADSPADALLSFLASGHLPWWFPSSRWSEAAQPSKWTAHARKTFLPRFLSLLKTKPDPVLRLARSLALPELKALFPKPNPSSPPLPSSSEEQQKLAFLASVLPQSSVSLKELQNRTPHSRRKDAPSYPSSPESAPPLPLKEGKKSTQPRTSKSESHDPNSNFQDVLSQVAQEQIAATRPDGLAIENAGLVLLHPFLSRLFQSLDYLDEKKQLRSDTRWRAVQILQFLGRGKAALPEHTLLLEKTLCAIPLAEVASFPQLTAEETAAAEHLLQAAIDHWAALGKTSLDGFRGSFLQRQGLLYLETTPIQLQVEKQAYDMLLDRLPWQFKYITLPWLRRSLVVQWRS
ncbi:contractile injection system tape measure protein [Pelagicoccus sp. SDUM812005]|uniref:contractile injection system tape measure protein n=1 Tax=Pelagicoccus sp. SDUM812005 TaxID=3041257 RepID=UPI00280E5F68|nr:contractile injection system tape measure protein [Pelagicoccus sp. SDUM812005]MDQ8180561.1 contractile injection system tape measure protein [Pelagicoccus sp. SDUM812005]